MFRKVLPFVAALSMFTSAYGMSFKGEKDGKVILDTSSNPIVIEMKDPSCRISVKPDENVKKYVFSKFEELDFRFSPEISYEGNVANVVLKALYTRTDGLGDSTFIPGGKYTFEEKCNGTTETESLDVIVNEGVVFNKPDSVRDGSVWDLSPKKNQIQVGYYLLAGGVEEKIVKYYDRETSLEKVIPFSLKDTGYLVGLVTRLSVGINNGKTPLSHFVLSLEMNPGKSSSYEFPDSRIKIGY